MSRGDTLLDIHPQPNRKMNQYLQHEIITYTKPRVCASCEAANSTIEAVVFWKKYYFCSEWCRLDFETNLRRQWRRFQLVQSQKH